MDAVSVSHWANEAFTLVFGFDPIGQVQEFFFGDWERLAATGIAIGHVGDAVYDLGFNLQGGAITLGGSWDGSAADAAYAHFTDVANGVAGFKDPLKEIANQYGVIAHGVWSAAEGLSGIIKGLLDAAIIAGVAFAAGTVTAESGVGLVVGYGVAALEVAEMFRLWNAATGLMQTVYSVVQIAAGVIESQLISLASATLPTLLGGAGYDHPLVTA